MTLLWWYLALLILALAAILPLCRVSARADSIMSAYQRAALMRERWRKNPGMRRR